MKKVHQKSKEGNDDKLEGEMEDLKRAIRRAVEIKVGKDASFEEREAAITDVINEAMKNYLEETFQKK